MIRFDILTVFPDQIEQFLAYGVFRIAQENNLLEYHVHDLRKWTKNKYKTVDDKPYGGGAGMVMKVEPVFEALKEIKTENAKVILFTPTGQTLDQRLVKDFASTKSVQYILLCGHYEGFDQRIHDHLADIEISIGNYVLSGGEIPALALMDGITRLVPGVLGNQNSLKEETFEEDKFEYPQYTRPEEFNGWKVPDILVSGNHKEIEKWKAKNSKPIK